MIFNIKSLKLTIKKLGVFDYLILFLVTITIIFLGIFFFRKQKTIEIWMKVSPKDIWWDKKPPYWLLTNLQNGDYEIDGMGRKAAEVVEMNIYERNDTNVDAYLKLRLRVTEDKRKKMFTFKSKQVEVGNPIELQFPNIYITGIIIGVEGAYNNLLEDKVVEVSLRSDRVNYPGTSGVDYWVADAIKVGDKMIDGQGNVLAEILSKNVKQADHIVTTSDGRIFLRQNPVLKDVNMTIRLKTSVQSGVNYFLYDQKVKIDNTVFVSLPDIDIFGVIIDII